MGRDWASYNEELVVRVMRVRNQLKKLGIVRKITYKAYEDTFAGKYKYTMKSRISKYYM
ncbi:MAG: hypothetical protein QXS17_02430 [Candidatus Micrarchaeaceae archaeon]